MPEGHFTLNSLKPHILQEGNALKYMTLKDFKDFIQTTGVIGEDKPIKCITLICCSRLVKNKEPTSNNLHPEDKSGVGKDYVVKKVLKVLFHKNVIYFINPTPTTVTLSQWNKVKKDKEGNIVSSETLGHKIDEDSIIYIEDASEGFLNGDDCKMLLGDNVDTKKRIENKYVSMKWDKPTIIITTADTVTGNQLLRRIPSMRMDSSKTQTVNIRNFNIAKNKLGYEKPDCKKYQDYFYGLEKFTVVIDKVEDKIKEYLESLGTINDVRTLSSRFIDLVKFSTAFNQRMRDKEGQTLYSKEEDVEIAKECFEYMYSVELLGFLSNMNARQKDIYQHFKNNSNEEFTANDVNDWPESYGVSIQTTYADMKAIMNANPKIHHITYRIPKKYIYLPNGTLEDWKERVEL